MKEIACYEIELSSHKFLATAFLKNDGLILDISGPNDHLGGIGIGIPYIRKTGEETANYHCISLPAHRDGELAGKIAQIISKTTRFHTVVLLGTHFPRLTKAKLRELINFLEGWAVDIGRQIVTDISSNSNKPTL